MAYNNVKVKARQVVAQSNTQTKDLGTVSEVPMGEWNETTPYKKLNLVRYKGATYIATQDNQGITPTGSGIWLLVNKDGRGVQSTAVTYQASVLGTTPPMGEWVSDVPTVPQGQYLWTRIIYTFTDETQTVAYSVSLQGLNFTQQDREDIDRIKDAIPSTASVDNPLATHDFVNSSINAMAAFYITYNAAGNAFPTKASLTRATTFYNAGKVRIPTQNDYVTVLSDESQTQNADGTYPTTRYVYQGGTYPNGQWELSFIVNTTTFTQAQLDAINSGITSQKISEMEWATSEKYTKPSSGIPESDLSSEVQNKLNDINIKEWILENFYPIGSHDTQFYGDLTPQEKYGGTWEIDKEYQGRTIIGSGGKYMFGEKGGSETVALSVNQIPSHVHTMNSHNHTVNTHTHSGPNHNHSFSGTEQSGKLIDINFCGDESPGATGVFTLSAQEHLYRASGTSKNNDSVRTVTFNMTPSGSVGYGGTGETGVSSPNTNYVTSVMNATGGGQQHENMQPYAVVNVWIRTA